MIRFVAAFALAAALTAGAATARSASTEDPDTYSVAIPYGDLNIASPAGLARLRARIHATAVQVCSVGRRVPLEEASLQDRCRADFLRSAQAQLSVAFARPENVVAGTR